MRDVNLSGFYHIYVENRSVVSVFALLEVTRRLVQNSFVERTVLS